MKCPSCDVVLPDDDYRAQSEHMTSMHPEVIEERMTSGGFFRGPDGQWIDGWA